MHAYISFFFRILVLQKVVCVSVLIMGLAHPDSLLSKFPYNREKTETGFTAWGWKKLLLNADCCVYKRYGGASPAYACPAVYNQLFSLCRAQTIVCHDKVCCVVDHCAKVFLSRFDWDLPVWPSFEVIMFNNLSGLFVSDLDFSDCCRLIEFRHRHKSNSEILSIQCRFIQGLGEISHTVDVLPLDHLH